MNSLWLGNAVGRLMRDLRDIPPFCDNWRNISVMASLGMFWSFSLQWVALAKSAGSKPKVSSCCWACVKCVLGLLSDIFCIPAFSKNGL